MICTHFVDLEAPTPTPNRDNMVAHFTFDHVQNHPTGYDPCANRGNFANPEYFETDSNESDSLTKDDENHRRKMNNSRGKKSDYYNDVTELCSDGGSTRGSTAESTTSI